MHENLHYGGAKRGPGAQPRQAEDLSRVVTGRKLVRFKTQGYIGGVSLYLSS